MGAAAVTPVLVEVGPATVSGPGNPVLEQVSAALASIDDPLALVDDRPVEVCALWRDVLAAAAGGHADILVLVVPTWWPAWPARSGPRRGRGHGHGSRRAATW
ncbi:hypothetical protein C6A87_005910 [Mycobacterium sp. ITM-2016-00317]|uniref:hypothetical protein n=1 Tax=Mycobacterium sp. ITM-2016-00317 TaxID=2099694 RepID=UPI00287F79A1|nr:hypothetical protein [Mycobacterium sp. ITM-2016-00317]WNG88756.1 hypothetical protein C6A87_005910 [Mycobacterium sp. ITM-2016-00317]